MALRAGIAADVVGFAGAHALCVAACERLSDCARPASGPLATRQGRVTLAAAAALLAVAQRWRDSSRQLAAAALITKLLPTFEGARRDPRIVAPALIFMSVNLWIRWPAAVAGKDNSMHPSFVSTYARLFGLGRKSADYGRDPAGYFAQMSNADWAHAAQSCFLWGLKNVGVVYGLQAVLRWWRSKEAKNKDRRRRLAALAEQLATAGYWALRTSLMYTVVTQYSLWVIAKRQHSFSSLWTVYGLPGPLGLISEPFSRVVTLAEYYVMHQLYTVVSDLRLRFAKGSAVPERLMRIAPALALAAFAFCGRTPPGYGVLCAIADKVAPVRRSKVPAQGTEPAPAPAAAPAAVPDPQDDAGAVPSPIGRRAGATRAAALEGRLG